MRPPLRLTIAVLAAVIGLSTTAGIAVAAPANDDFASAEALSGNRGTALIDLIDATAEPGEPTDAGTDERTIWFTYTPSASGFASFSFCDADPFYEIVGANLSIFTGAELVSLAPEADSSGGCPVDQVNAAITNMAVTAGTTYRLQVGASNASAITGATLTYDFNTDLPANDDFADATDIVGALPLSLDADSGLATTELDEPDVDFLGPFNSLWYRWTPDSSALVAIDTCSTESEIPSALTDSRLQLYTNSSDPADFAGLAQQAANDDGCSGSNPFLSRIFHYVNAGTEYWIRIVNATDRFGAPYELNIHQVTTPEIAGTPYIYPQDATVLVGEQLFAGVPDWYAEPDITSIEIHWQLCDASGANCVDIAGATGASYTPTADDVSHRLRLKVTGFNESETAIAYSEPSSPVVLPDPPVVPDPPTSPAPPSITPPLDPFPQPSIPRSLGKVKLSKKGSITLTKLRLSCGEAATGDCAGSITFTSAKVKKSGKTIKQVKSVAKLRIRPGKTLAPTFKLSSRMVKAIRAAKSLKTSIAIELGAPSFSTKRFATGVILSHK